MTHNRRRHDGEKPDYEDSSVLVGILMAAVLGITAGIVIAMVLNAIL